MHYFLKGNSGVGKSTIVQRVLEQVDKKVGGFYTQFDAPRGTLEKKLYILPAQDVDCIAQSDEDAYAWRVHAQCVAESKDGVPMKVYTDIFNTYGINYLKQARSCELIVMDECGRLEQKAEGFMDEVLAVLDEDIPVLGVICYKPGAFTARLQKHPQVQVLEVTVANREDLVQQLIESLQGTGQK